MRNHRLLARPWMLPVVAVLLAVHGFILYRIVSRLTFTAIVGVLVLLLIKHLGVFGSIYGMIRRRSSGPT